MASTRCQSIAASYPYGSIFEFDIQSSKHPASSDGQSLGFAACFNLSTVGEPVSMVDRRFRLARPMGQFLLSRWTTNLSDSHGLLSLMKFLPNPKQVIDLTLEDDEDDHDNDDVTEVSWLSNTPMAQ
jgi:hypothetical protein